MRKSPFYPKNHFDPLRLMGKEEVDENIYNLCWNSSSLDSILSSSPGQTAHGSRSYSVPPALDSDSPHTDVPRFVPRNSTPPPRTPIGNPAAGTTEVDPTIGRQSSASTPPPHGVLSPPPPANDFIQNPPVPNSL
ncbi:hypothetical protein CSIM01_06688 [Colletotrichum simmondsii]|uniref:Uncharacterized protein n=1 Tax=Colletotrichum simmondsii TaxID=703756 RepID=A0A135SUM7_9PEZI|nr:hypothetical protein CSIM01_06688 [Colletotrichum simmondsii]